MKATAVLQTDIEFFAAALLQTPVSIWTRTADDIYALLVEESIIVKYTPDSIKVNCPQNPQYDGYYLREEFEFRVQRIL